MDFGAHVLPAKRSSVFNPDPENLYVWCGSAIQGEDGKYYLYYSFWPRRESFYTGWVTHSQIGAAVSDSPTGPFEPLKIVLPVSGRGWDADCTHNPTIRKFNGRYYLYYMGNYGDGTYWNHRNHQRIGVAVADHPAGPFERFDRPLIDVSPGMHDSLMTSNPSVAQMPDGRYIMVYKAVSDQGELPAGGSVVCGVAFSDSPVGPFEKHPQAIFRNPEKSWSVEDPFIWTMNGRLYALVKDYHGYFTHAERDCTALMESEDGIRWEPSAPPLAKERAIVWEDGERQEVHLLERPQLLLDGKGMPRALYCACAQDGAFEVTFNVAFALDF